ncbi:MAG: DUF427 domain-containing protein [Methylobacteriaceae bacterium]|nr:DUF427 domain-containing protein [Methylobacteriaceae bacterium]
MNEVAPRIPGPDHPITVTPAQKRVRVLWQGTVIADSRDALDLKEASYPVVKYIPRTDVDMSLLHRTARHTHCPYKGDASYFSIQVDGATSADAIWSYEHPFPAVAMIKDPLAFYPDKIDRIDESEA